MSGRVDPVRAEHFQKGLPAELLALPKWAGEDQSGAVVELTSLGQHVEGLLGERDRVFSIAALHALSGDRLRQPVEVDLRPLRSAGFPAANSGEDEELQGPFRRRRRSRSPHGVHWTDTGT